MKPQAMPSRRLLLALLLGAVPLARAAVTALPAADLSLEQILDKNAQARGGLDAWRRVQSMRWIGHITSAAAPAQLMPFMLELQRPNHTHFELIVQSQKSLRVFDGSNGWKLHPKGSGSTDLQPYSPEELKFASDEQVIDGPLLDHAAKGVTLLLEGIDEVEGRKAYRLVVKPRTGVRYRLWLDAETFLELKHEREMRNAMGLAGTVVVTYRNYQTVDGLQIPLLLETSGVDPKKTPNQMVLDRVLINPTLSPQAFAKPAGSSQRRATVTIHADESASSSTVPPALRRVAP